MENEMLEQIQQMITTANEGLAQNIRREVVILGTELRQEIAAMESRMDTQTRET